MSKEERRGSAVRGWPRRAAVIVAGLTAVGMLAGPVTAASADQPSTADTTQVLVPTAGYRLGLSLTMSRPDTGLVVGGTGVIRTTVHVSRGQSIVDERVAVLTVLHYEGHPHGYAKKTVVSKRAVALNHGDTAGGSFSPADFGWDSWQEGEYWFQSTATRQGSMIADASTTAHDPAVSFSLMSKAPQVPLRRVDDVTAADGMSAHVTVSSGTGVGGWRMTLADKLDAHGTRVSVKGMRVMMDDRNVSDDWTLTWDGEKSVVTAVYDGQHMLPSYRTVTLEYDLTVHDPSTGLVDGRAWSEWNEGERTQSGEASFRQWAPNPNVAWIRYDTDKNQWTTVADADRSNTVGVDGKRLLDGDKTSLAVNGTFPKDPAQAPETFSLSADWTAAADLFQADAENVRVYMANTRDVTRPTVGDIAVKGRDVTDQFTIDVKDDTITARLNSQYLDSLATDGTNRQYTLLIPGRISYKDGVAGMLASHGKNAGSELDACATADGIAYTATGAQTVNEQTVTTNRPGICAYVPGVTMRVTSPVTGRDANNKYAGEGDMLAYAMSTAPTLPDLAYPVNQVTLTGSYDPNTIPDWTSLTVSGQSTALDKHDYTLTRDDAHHRFTVTLTGKMLDMWKTNGKPQLTVSWHATVHYTSDTSKTTASGTLAVNGQTTASDTVSVLSCRADGSCKPTGTQTTTGEDSTSVDGKSVLLGDKFVYRATLKSAQASSAASPVWRLGLVFDYDANHVTADTSNIRLIDMTTGQDATVRANITTDAKRGLVYAFLKTVDTTVNGHTVKGDPQPTDLAAYAASDDHDPTRDPAIDQTVLGHEFQLVIPVQVTKTSDALVRLDAKATQITDRTRVDGEVMSTTLKPISPSQDVTVNVGDQTSNGGSVYQNSQFLYRMDSSLLPPDRAERKITQWALTGKYDPKYDRYTGQWAVYATRDVIQGGRMIAHKGERIAGSGYTNPNGDWFTVTDHNGVLTVTATAVYLNLVSANTLGDQGWRAYAQFTRIAAADRVGMTITETLNGQTRGTSVAWTRTPDRTPRLTIVKYDTVSGITKGDRNSTDQALKLTEPRTKLTFRITNASGTDANGNGSWFRARDLVLSDRLVAGDGKVQFEYPADWETRILKPGEHIDVTGWLTGVKTHHTDRATVTGTPLGTCPAVDRQPFDGEDTQPVDRDSVNVNGLVLCRDTKVTSQADDWNAYAGDTLLANTGMGNTWLALTIGLVILLILFCVFSLCKTASRADHALERNRRLKAANLASPGEPSADVDELRQRLDSHSDAKTSD